MLSILDIEKMLEGKSKDEQDEIRREVIRLQDQETEKFKEFIADKSEEDMKKITFFMYMLYEMRPGRMKGYVPERDG